MSTNDSPTVCAADVDPAGLASRMNAFIESQIPVMYRLGIRIVDLREGFVVGAAPLAGNVNHLGTMYAGTLFGLAEFALDAQLTDTAGVVVATTHGTYQVRAYATTSNRKQ